MHPKHRNNYFIKVDKRYQKIMNNRVYPFINPVTRELEWWCKKQDWNNSSHLIQLADINNPYF